MVGSVPGTFTVNRIDLKRMLTALGISEGTVQGTLNTLDKMHRHVNAIAFVGMLERLGLKQYDINNILRRIGIDDTTIAEIFNMLDEEKIQSAFGRVIKLEVE